MTRSRWFVVVSLAVVTTLISSSGLAQKKAGIQKMIDRGRALVEFGGCNDCHSPKVFTKEGPAPDVSKLLSGSPSSTPLPAMPENVLGPEKWGAVTSNDMTVWVGPWGVSFTANLTPDKNTGLGNWTEAMFIKAMRTGKHMGEGRMILPPMPWQGVATLPDGDLRAIFAYLHSLKPVNNPVHDPIPPSGGMVGK
jgi:hypothetical protein